MKTVLVRKSDYKYSTKFDWYYKGEHDSPDRIITKRWGDTVVNYWGYVTEDGEEFKVKWVVKSNDTDKFIKI